MAQDRFELLSDDQRKFLRLAFDGLTSKQIAQRRGGSYHTVNAQIALAVRVLGARDRTEAARLLVTHEREASYDASYDPPPIAAPGNPAADRSARRHSPSGLPLPFATRGRPTNALTFWQKTAWVIVLAAAIALILGGLLSGVIAQLNALGTRV